MRGFAPVGDAGWTTLAAASVGSEAKLLLEGAPMFSRGHLDGANIS